MKELFSDVPQMIMEAELEEKPGYERSERAMDSSEKGMSKNYRIGARDLQMYHGIFCFNAGNKIEAVFKRGKTVNEINLLF